ncbi:methyltransferase family protein [Labedaea rhizosphaerae]|uniref:Methyltransferase family protein n=2 Tax=Labedaea rhizosphaerae TaxID=598644 RepID=A0A4R6SH66_LABRH|nr:methyltransferase family protein [Labedaea rhizosphaerae]
MHPDRLAPTFLQLLAPIAERGGTVLEIGCGTGMLTRHLVAAGLNVIASDASADMLELAREQVPGAVAHRVIALPDDALPEVDAIVGVGHPLNYFTGAEPVHASLTAIANALRPGGVLAIDLMVRTLGLEAHPPMGRLGADWALISTMDIPEPGRSVRHLTTFVRTEDGTYRRADEDHEFVHVDGAAALETLRRNGVDATLGQAFGPVGLPEGLASVIGAKA